MSKDLSARYYQKYKEKLEKTFPEWYQGLSVEEKNKKWEYGWK